MLILYLFISAAHAATSAQTAKEKQAKKAKNEAVQITDQPPQPVINYVYPAGGQRGKTISAIVGGTNLVSGTNFEGSIHLSGHGINAKVIEAMSANLVRISIDIAPDAEIGQHTIRFVDKGGASNRYRFEVGDLMEINEKEPNSNKEQAQTIPTLPVVINGQIQQEDRDYFKFAARKGQNLVLAAEAQGLLPFLADAVPGWFDPVLTVYDAKGKKLACVDDYHLRPDPVLVFAVPADGDYIVEIVDSIYRGREDFVYRLTIGELPWIDRVFPLGGQRGQTISAELQGANLATNTLTVILATNAPGVQHICQKTGHGLSNALPFAAGDSPELLEAEPNDSTNQAMRISTPITINGRIDRPGDDDWFVFTAKEGEKLSVEVFARRLDSPLDSILTLFNSKGVELAQNDDTVDPTRQDMTHHADSRIVFTFPSAGDFYLRLRDVQNKGGNDFAYRLAISPPKPDFALRFSPDNPRAGLGDSAVFTVSALRRDGFDGAITISVTNLPAGFVASEATIPANQDQISLTVTVPPNGELGMITPRIVGSMVDGTIEHEAEPSEAMMQAFAYTHLMPSDECLMTVMKAGSFTLAADLGTNAVFRVTPGTTNTFPIKIVRKENARGGVSINLSKPPPGINARASFIQADKSEGTVTVVTQKQTRPGVKFNLILTGTLRSGKNGSISIAPAVPIEVVADAK